MSSTVQQAPGIKRTYLQQRDLSVPGRAPAFRHGT
jgi:hypothetical protein